MQNPAQEIAPIVALLTSTISPDIQKAAFDKYFTADAGFRHPLCAVAPGPLSRENILGIYQWYRVMSPKIDLEVKNVVYDRPRNVLFLDVIQQFHIRYSPFQPAPVRLLVRLTLRKENGLFHIASQEDFYHPDELVSLIVPPLAPVVQFAMYATAIASNIYAKSAQVLGFWRIGSGEGTSPNTDRGHDNGEQCEPRKVI